MLLSVTVASMNAFAKRDCAIADPFGRLIATVADGQIQSVNPCSATCLWPAYHQRKVELIALGGTRKEIPGVRIGPTLLVSNVFTTSHRQGWPVRRSFAIYQEVVARLSQNPIPGVLEIEQICICSTALEFLDGYFLLDNSSPYTPPQHKNQAWVDSHTADDFEGVLRKIKSSVEALHHQGIIHTDVTGFNILIDPLDNPVIIDLFSCLTFEAIGPRWFPDAWKRWIGQKIEMSQINQFLLAPAIIRWSRKFVW